MKTYNVLIFPAGTEIAMEIYHALCYAKNIHLFGGSSVAGHGEMLFDDYVDTIPFIHEASFFSELNAVLKRYAIDFVYPAYDAVQLFLMQHAKEIQAKVISAPLQTVAVCRSKGETYRALAQYSFVPKVYEGIGEIEQYPVFLKPDVGQGSEGVQLIRKLTPATRQMMSGPDNILCEFLPGPEYTVDCFTDASGCLQAVLPRTRERIKMGISVRSRSMICDASIAEIAQCINETFVFSGAWFFQLKKDAADRYKLLEISARIPGTMGVSRNLGMNFPLLTLYVFAGVPVEVRLNRYGVLVDRTLFSCYKLLGLHYTDVYVDFDDTLIIRQQVNLCLIRFLYQAVNQHKRIHLLTRHSGDLAALLRAFRISETLFDSIIHLLEDEPKSCYVTSKDAIFIDDSFAERREVAERMEIPVFDTDMVEGLLEYK